MGIADMVIWLIVVFIVVACVWIVRGVFRRAEPVTAPPPRPAVVYPSYLPRWDGTRKWCVAQEKNDWVRAYNDVDRRAQACPAGPRVYRGSTATPVSGG